jgi:hypothetical protein
MEERIVIPLEGVYIFSKRFVIALARGNVCRGTRGRAVWRVFVLVKKRYWLVEDVSQLRVRNTAVFVRITVRVSGSLCGIMRCCGGGV